MKKFLLIILILILIPIGILAYLGFVPGLSPLITKPIDLGIKADPSLVTVFETKYAVPAGVSTAKLDVSLSSTEITSVFAVWQERDKLFPLRDVQIRFNPDGTGEASGYLKLGSAVALAKNLGYTDADINKGKEYIQYISGDLPFYVKGTGGMLNNQLTINPSTFRLGNVTVPSSITTPATRVVGDMITRRLKQIGGANIEEASFKTGVLKLKGTVPSTIKYD
ncbi:MAG: hypothetical protein ACD_40C00320G0003 [uncultured bacterium]|nr:MAG: hypothetical protein ACD_40C00320G0003 [uncultured bacterium]